MAVASTPGRTTRPLLSGSLRSSSRLALLFIALTSVSGCGTLGYLFQAGRGQLAIMNRAKPIEDVLQDERTPPRLKALLAHIEPIKRFGESQGLKPTRNYTEYVQLDRPAATWVVSASEVLEFKSKEWSFPFVGEVPYLGWFDLDQAKEFAEELRRQGLDVDLRGAGAYSTLGWFHDPVLSSMIPRGEEALGDLVNVVLHESVHATVYVPGQAYFNESLASFVADRLTYVYLDQKLGVGAGETEAYRKIEARREKRQERLYRAYNGLKEIYASPRSAEAKLAEKTKILTTLKNELEWTRDLNNATLIQYKAYHTAEGFEALFAHCGGSWTKFWSAVGRIGEKDFRESQQEQLAPVFSGVLAAGC